MAWLKFLKPRSIPHNLRPWQFVSFPKSGRSWLRYALRQLDLENKINFHHDGFEYSPHNPCRDFHFATRRQRYSQGPRPIYLHRDPRDVMVSLFHHATGRYGSYFNFRGSISDFIRDPYFGAFNLQIFRSQWAALLQDGRAIEISYEACHEDFPAVLAAITSHYGLNIKTAALIRASKAASFAKMQAAEQADKIHEEWLQTLEGHPKVRNGRVGGYATALIPADIAYLNATFFPHLAA